jgi:predicted tellurium resistance membrane protein TerC
MPLIAIEGILFGLLGLRKKQKDLRNFQSHLNKIIYALYRIIGYSGLAISISLIALEDIYNFNSQYLFKLQYTYVLPAFAIWIVIFTLNELTRPKENVSAEKIS